MQRLTDQAVAEFMDMYQKYYGIAITKVYARDIGERLVGLVRAVYYPRKLHRDESTKKGGV